MCHLVQPSDRSEYETSNTTGPLLQSGRTVDAVSLDGWRVDIGYPEDREEAEARLMGKIESEDAIMEPAGGD